MPDQSRPGWNNAFPIDLCHSAPLENGVLGQTPDGILQNGVLGQTPDGILQAVAERIAGP
eukprot:5105473-Lingulodinium_polyedra.AAC.1